MSGNFSFRFTGNKLVYLNKTLKFTSFYLSSVTLLININGFENTYLFICIFNTTRKKKETEFTVYNNIISNNIC